MKYIEMAKKGKDKYQDLKKKLMEKIVTNRIFQESELKALYEMTLRGNQSLDKEKLKDMWNQIMTDLNV